MEHQDCLEAGHGPFLLVRAEFILDPKEQGQRWVVRQGETLGQVGGRWGKGHQEVAAAAAGRFWGCLNRSSHKKDQLQPPHQASQG